MLNTEDLYDQVGQILLERRGQDFTKKLKLEMMGLPGPKAFQLMRERCDLSESVEELQSETDLIFQDMLPAQLEMMPGLEKLLKLVEKKSIPKAIATSSHRQFATQALGYFELEKRFEFILTSEDVINGKPNPEVYFVAAQRLRVEPESMLVLEDSFIGSTAAAKSGAFTVAVPTSHSIDMDFSHVDLVARRLDDDAVFDLLG